jgi:mono/diheme cytochrome c family protein
MAAHGWYRPIVASAAMILLPAALAVAQGTPQVERKTAPYTSPASGEEMFRTYCTVCHGPEGQGDGPAAVALKKPPANLARLASSNGGSFPVAHVEQVLQYGVRVPAHGSSDMPIWGEAFRQMGDASMVRMRVANLVRHLQTLQAR